MTAPASPRRPRWPAAALAALVLLAALALWLQARRVGLWSNDEEYFVQLARLLSEHFPAAVWDLPVNAFDERGIQRLTILLLAVPLSDVNGVLGFDLARALMCLVFATAAIPAYLLVRGAGLGPGWALLAALLAVAVPWATVTMTFLSESVAYPLALWAVWGAWRACVVPGVRSDVLALALAVLAAFARTNLIVLLGVAPAALALMTLTRAAGGEGLRIAGRRLVREHPLLSVVLVVGTAVVALNLLGIQPGPVRTLAGTYVTNITFTTIFAEKVAFQAATIILGVGLVPAILGLPWILARAFRGADPREQALAACSLVAILLLLLSTLYAAAEERYVLYLAPLVLLPGLVALARRAVPVWAILLSGALVAWLVGHQEWVQQLDPARLITFPAEAFFTRVVLNNLDVRLGGDPLTLFVIAIVVVTVLVALARRSARATLVLAAAVAVFMVAETRWLEGKYAAEAGGVGDLAERTWVDRLVPGDQPVALQATGLANSGEYVGVFRELTFWNRQADLLLSTAPALETVQIPRYGGHAPVRIDEASGRLTREDGGAVPRYVVAPTLFRDIGLRAESVGGSAYLPLELLRLRGPARATYRWTGNERDGWLTAAAPEARAEIFPASREAAGRPCLRFRLVAPPGARGGHRFTVTAGDERIDGRLRAERTRDLEVPLRAGVDEVVVRASGFERGERRLSLQLANTGAGACGAG